MTLSIKMMLSAVIALLAVLTATSTMMALSISRQEQTIQSLADGYARASKAGSGSLQQAAVVAELKQIETLLSLEIKMDAHGIALEDAQVARQKAQQDAVRRLTYPLIFRRREFATWDRRCDAGTPALRVLWSGISLRDHRWHGAPCQRSPLSFASSPVEWPKNTEIRPILK